MKSKKYELTQDRLGHPAGTICYECHMCAYGLTSDDERFTGTPHMFMTLDENHGYPGFTVPSYMLREVRE